MELAKLLRARYHSETGKRLSISDDGILAIFEEVLSRYRGALDVELDTPATLVDDDNTATGVYLPMAVRPGDEPPSRGWHWHPSLVSGRREGEPEPPYVPPEAPGPSPTGRFYVGPRPRARTMAEVQAMARHPSSFGPPGAPGAHPEFDRADLRLVPSEDGEPTYAKHEPA